MRLVRIDRPPSAGVTRRQRRIALVVSMLLFAIAAFVVGTAARSPQPDPIQTRQGVPVGVERTPAGAVAAADDYLAIEQASVERDPVRFAALVAEDYSATLRASAVTEARADRHRDPRGVRLWLGGGQSFTTVAAQRLDRYRSDSAQVTVWAGQVFWGATQPPSQVWGLSRVNLVWQAGRWQVTSMASLREPAPAPAELPQASSGDDTSEVLSSELDGFSPVSYGSPQ